MLSFNIPLLMVGAFLVLTLVVGLYFSRKKITTLREYAVGNKQFATATLVATVLATEYGGGGLVRLVKQVHKLGLYWIVLRLLSALVYWIISPLAIRMAPFMQHLSMPETLGNIYGRYPRVIAAFSCIGCSIAVIAIQITVMSSTISMCLGSVSPKYITISTISATLILIFYSTFGGIRAVTFTDVLQFITFTIIIPLLAWLMFTKINKPVAEIIPFLQSQTKFQFRNVFHFDTKLIAMIAMLLSGLMSYIDPTTMQRMYMCSGPIQAKKVLLYSCLFSVTIRITTILIGLFVFIEAPDLPIENVWTYIMEQIPSIFKGFISISLLAMTMSTADSRLNTCAVMVSHDMLESVRGAKAVPYANPLRLARFTSIVVGLCAMLLAFFRTDLLDLLLLGFDCSVPILTAPFILAIFGFRGTSRTALIGMATGALTILIWNKWVKPLEPEIGIQGAFVCMLANGLAMMAAHYLLPQPPGTGWVGPDDELKQIRQANTRKKARQKEETRAFFSKENLAKFKPNTTALMRVGIYIMVTALLGLCIVNAMHLIYWPLFQLAIGGWWVAYAVFFQAPVPDWKVGRYWLLSLVVCFPINILWYWWYMTYPLLILPLSLVHLAVTLWLLPLYWGIRIVVATLLGAMFICCLGESMVWPSTTTLLPLLGLGLLIFASIIYVKSKAITQANQIDYLINQQKLRKEQQIKEIAYNLNIYPSTACNDLAEDGTILQKVVKDVTQSIAFVDNNTPLYKEDFQSIINKFSEWAIYLKNQAKSKDHILLVPICITIDALIGKLEVALEREASSPPRLLIEKQEGTLPAQIICDVNQIIHLLVTVVLSIVDVKHLDNPLVKIQLYATQLQYEQNNPSDSSYLPALTFPAIALVISNATTLGELPKVIKSYYPYMANNRDTKQSNRTIALERIGIEKQAIERIVQAHYGFLEMSFQNAMLLVLPCNINHIREEMISKLPMELLTSETAITPKEQGDSMMVLMEFHEYVCQVAEVDPGVIAGILLLLRRCYGFKRHASGQLFYVRVVGIAQLVATWIFHSPKPIYAALLYDLIRYTRLPLSYIKANYDMGIFCFVENVLSVDKQQELAESLLYVSNRFKEAINQDHLSVLYIKLAERLYDLRHAAGYSNLEEVKYMAKETLTVDVELARNYLEPEIVADLETAARQALEIYKRKV